MHRGYLTFCIGLSPILLAVVLFDTLLRGAYPSDGDSIGIPMFGYLFFFYPFALYLSSKIQGTILGKPDLLFWNTKRNVFSFFSLLLSIYPLGLMWVAFGVTSLSCHAYGSFGICLLMVVATATARTYAIQTPSYEEPSRDTQPSS